MIYLYWLSGCTGSSSAPLVKRVRSGIRCVDIEAPGLAPEVTFVILDFSMVSGVDSSAFVSLTKLRNFCDQRGARHRLRLPVIQVNRAVLERIGFFGAKKPPPLFDDLNAALAWCEDQRWAKAGLDTNNGLAGFEPWLQRQLGGSIQTGDLLAYLERKDIAGSQVLYREGDPADTVDLVAAGQLNIEIAQDVGGSVLMRRIKTQTVVGEMGFFRRSPCSATNSSDGPAIIYTLTRFNFEKMRRERPDLASAFDDFILRILADRVAFANRQVASLSR